jgi:hypothetical protein
MGEVHLKKWQWGVLIVAGTVAATILFSQFCWFKRNEHVALWLEGMALVFIFGLDHFNRLDAAREHKRLSEETLKRQEETNEQLKLLRQQAQAASDAAVAAKKSADLTAEIQRPHMGINAIILSGSTRYWVTTISLRNFGALSAVDVVFKIQYFVDDSLRYEHPEPKTLQVFPLYSYHVSHQFDSGDPDANPIRTGIKKLTGKAYVRYQSPDGRQFEYLAELSYPAGYGGNVDIIKSSTTEIKPT